MRRFFPLWLLVMLLTKATSAQDNHYEYMKMGSRNSILANAGLARFEDQSAVIFNPATLSFANQSSFSFNTTAVGYSNINFQNGLGQGFDIKYGNLNILPNMAAGVLKPKKDKKDFVLGYSIYHPINDRLRFTDRNQYQENVVNDAESPGLENYLAQLNISHDVDEVTAILGIGWNISEHVALGVSQSFTYRSEEYLNSFTASAVPVNSQTSSVDFVSFQNSFYTRYYKVMAITKLGLAMQLGKWDIGVTAHLPSLGIMGSGEVMAQGTFYNVHPEGDLSKPRQSLIASGRAEKQKATYKKSMALGVGVSRPFRNVRLYGAINAYSGVRNYNIMDPGGADYAQPPNNIGTDPSFMRVLAGNQTVINGSFGVDWNHEGNKHWLFSFHSDKHFADIDKNYKGHYLTIKNWDNYHLAIGKQRSFGNSDWVIGMRYSFAKKTNATQPYSFDDPTEENYLQGKRQTGTVIATSIQLMLSYAFRFR